MMLDKVEEQLGFVFFFHCDIRPLSSNSNEKIVLSVLQSNKPLGEQLWFSD